MLCGVAIKLFYMQHYKCHQVNVGTRKLSSHVFDG